MKKKIIFSAVALAFLVGCGNSGGSSNSSTASNMSTQPSTANQTAKTVKVVDGYVIGAHVCDGRNVCVTTDKNGVAEANFANTVLTAKAGYIDVNNNKKIDENDIALPNTFTLKTTAGKSVISPLTDLVANGADAKKLAKLLNVNEDDLFTDPYATNNITLAKAIQIVYAIKADNKETDFIKEINNINVDTNTTTTTTTKPQATTDLPPFPQKVKTDLPDFDSQPQIVSSNNENNSNNTALNGGLEVFASLAKKVVSQQAQTLIDEVVKSNAQNPINLEESIASIKKELVEPKYEIQNNQAALNETNQTQENNSTLNQQNAQSQNTTSNNQTTTNETNQTQNTNEETTQTQSANTDLPPF